MTLHRGQTVRLVSMDGCMATIRNNIREGVVIGFVDRVFYGSIISNKVAQIQLEDCVVERVAEPRYWTEYDGLMEYRE